MGITLIIAFTTGLLAFLSPCVLPLVPVYLASVCGPEILEAGSRRSRATILCHTLSFSLSFSLVFVAMGTVAGFAGFALSSAPVTRNLGGALLIVFGLFILATLRFPGLNFQKRFNPSLGKTSGYLRSLLIGFIFSLAWAPCIIALLGGTLSLALSTSVWWQGAYLLAVFSLGLALPFIIIGLAFDSLMPLVKRLNRHSSWLYILGSLLLIAVGASILTGLLGG